jgi:hypothetical protein
LKNKTAALGQRYDLFEKLLRRILCHVG